MTGHGDSLPPITQLPPHLPLCGRCLFLHHQPPLSQTQSWSSPLIRGPHLQLGASAVLSYHQAQVTVYCNYPPGLHCRRPLHPNLSLQICLDLSHTHTHNTQHMRHKVPAFLHSFIHCRFMVRPCFFFACFCVQVSHNFS